MGKGGCEWRAPGRGELYAALGMLTFLTGALVYAITRGDITAAMIILVLQCVEGVTWTVELSPPSLVIPRVKNGILTVPAGPWYRPLARERVNLDDVDEVIYRMVPEPARGEVLRWMAVELILGDGRRVDLKRGKMTWEAWLSLSEYLLRRMEGRVRFAEGDVASVYLRNDIGLFMRALEIAPLPTAFCASGALFIVANVLTGTPTSPAGWFIKILANIVALVLIAIYPFVFMHGYDRRRNCQHTAYYRPDEDGFTFITHGPVKRAVRFDEVRAIRCASGSRSAKAWIAYTHRKETIISPLGPRASFRALIHYLRWAREDPNASRSAVVIWSDETEEKVREVLGVSAGSGDWWRFVDDFWRHGDGKFLLSAPMEVILERVRCPWTLNEMDSPAEEERVYIDERKMRNDLC